MAPPTTETESSLKAYLHASVLQDMAETLGWTVDGGSYDAVVDEALADYCVADIATVSGVKQVQALRACARFHLWRQVMDATAKKFDIADAGQSLRLSQINVHAREIMESARLEMERLKTALAHQVAAGDVLGGEAASMNVYGVVREDDPFSEEGAAVYDDAS